MALNFGTLAGGATRVENDLGVLTGVDYEADNPFGVAEDGSAQQRLVNVDWVFSIGHVKGSGEPIHVVVGWFTVYGEGDVGVCAGFGVTKVGQFRASTSRLEVRLSVQVFRFDEGHVLFLGSRTDDDVCGDRFVVVDLDEISNLDILPSTLTPTRVVFVLSPVKKVAAVVLLLMLLCPIRGVIVLITVVVGLLRIFLIGGRARRSCALLHFDIPMLHHLRFLSKRSWDKPPNKSSALLPSDIVIDEFSAF